MTMNIDYGAICDAIKVHRSSQPRADRVRVLT
jgi:hypothetical protein